MISIHARITGIRLSRRGTVRSGLTQGFWTGRRKIRRAYNPTWVSSSIIFLYFTSSSLFEIDFVKFLICLSSFSTVSKTSFIKCLPNSASSSALKKLLTVSSIYNVDCIHCCQQPVPQNQCRIILFFSSSFNSLSRLQR